MLYHYTNIPAMMSILKDARDKRTMCFWATRYDCFADDKEYRLGVETIRRLLPMVEQGLPEDRRVAQDFDWKLIEGNVNLPYPYIVSLTARPDNEYMWSEYAKKDGVVLEVDDSVFVPNQELTMMMLKPCIYAGLLSDQELTKQIMDEYTTGYMRSLFFLQQFSHIFIDFHRSALNCKCRVMESNFHFSLFFM